MPPRMMPATTRWPEERHGKAAGDAFLGGSLSASWEEIGRHCDSAVWTAYFSNGCVTMEMLVSPALWMRSMDGGERARKGRAHRRVHRRCAWCRALALLQQAIEIVDVDLLVGAVRLQVDVVVFIDGHDHSLFVRVL